MNLKSASLSERDNCTSFEPNKLGLYNVSEMFNRFDEGNDRSHKLASTMLLDNYPQSESFIKIGSEYFSDLSTFCYMVRFNSEIYADGCNMLESGKCTTYAEYGEAFAKKASIVSLFGNDEECYFTNALFTMSRFTFSVETSKNLAINYMILLDRLCKEIDLQGEVNTFFRSKAWYSLDHEIHEFISRHIQTDPGLQNKELFWNSYNSCLTFCNEVAENLAKVLKEKQ